MDRATAIKAIARNLRDLIADSVPASLGATFVDSVKLIHPETGQLRGYDFYIYSGVGAGQQRTVASFDPVNNRLGFAEVLTTVPSINSNFLLFRQFPKDEYDNAIDRMVGLAQQQYLQEFTATISIVGTQFEYVVPSGMEYINTLRLVPSGGAGYSDYEVSDYVNRIYEISSSHWRIEQNPLGSYLISFDPRKVSLDDLDGDSLRIMGQAKPVINATDNATITPDLEEYIISGATALLASQRIDEGREWQAKFYLHRDNTRTLEQYIFRPRRGKRVG